MLQVRGGQGSEQRRQRAPHLAEVLQKLSVKRFSTTSCNGSRTPREEVWSGWAGIAQKTGFGRVSPLPGIWPTLHLDTAITLPVGVTER